MKYREPVVADSFYSLDPQQLQQDLAGFLQSEPEHNLYPKALIVPHAGYFYSGAVAGAAYSYLKKLSNVFKRVVILGPSHQIPLSYCAISDDDAFNTPLGPVSIDKAKSYQLLNLDLVKPSKLAHRWEHAIEVQLPFLQHLLTGFEIIPIVVGCRDPQQVAQMLALACQGASCLIIVSTDLSHYNSPYECRRLDNLSIDRILNLDPHLEPHDACGCLALNGLLKYSNTQDWKIKLVKQANSGDVGNDKKEVVGYASFVLY